MLSADLSTSVIGQMLLSWWAACSGWWRRRTETDPGSVEASVTMEMLPWIRLTSDLSLPSAGSKKQILSVFKTFICIFLLKSSVQSVIWQECMREDMIGSKQSHEHHHHGYQCHYWSLKNKHLNPENPTKPRPSHTSHRPAPPWHPLTPPTPLPHNPALPEQPGESLNSVQALQRDERRKDEDIKDNEY